MVTKATTDADKIDAFTKLSDYYGEFNIDSAYHYAVLAKESAIRAKNRSAEGYAIGNISESYSRRGNHVQALTLLYQALAIFKEIGDSINIANTYHGLGNFFRAQGDRHADFFINI